MKNKLLIGFAIIGVVLAIGASYIFGLKQWLLMDDKSNGFVTYNSFNGIKDISGNGHNCICYNAPVFSDSPTKLHSGRR